MLRSKAILITDPGHAVPVQVNRNGLRAIAFGTGAPDSVSIRYLTASADIKEGDLLVSSGIGAPSRSATRWPGSRVSSTTRTSRSWTSSPHRWPSSATTRKCC